MAAGATYQSIATTTLGSAASSYTFSSIPSTYTDLILVCGIFNSSSGANAYVRLNGDSGSNYSRTQLTGNGTTAASGRASNTTSAYIDAVSTNYPQEIITVHFMNYSNTTTYKTFLARADNASTGTQANVSLWRSTSAINSIAIYTDTGNFSTGSTFTLYGIASA